MMVMLFQMFKHPDRSKVSVSYSDFLNMVDSGGVNQVTIQGENITGMSGQGPFKTYAPKDPELISMLPTRVNKALQAFAAANPGLVEYDSRHGMVKIKSDLTFALGSTTATQSAVAALTKLVGIINDPVIAGYHVYIAGHTDNVRIRKPETKKRHPDNWYLSVHRAVAIKKVMQTAGLAPARIGVMGFGEYHPVATNKARGGNVRNRRVEIWIVPPDRFLTSSSGGAAAVVDEK